MAELVQALQVVSGALWLLPAALLLPALIRTWRGTATAAEVLATPMFFVALNQPGFTLRWLLWPHALPSMGATELQFWAALYVLSCLAAIGVSVAWFAARRGR